MVQYPMSRIGTGLPPQSSDRLEWDPQPASSGVLTCHALPAVGSGGSAGDRTLFFLNAINTQRTPLDRQPLLRADEQFISGPSTGRLARRGRPQSYPGKSDNHWCNFQHGPISRLWRRSASRPSATTKGFMHHKIMLVDDEILHDWHGEFRQPFFRLNFEITIAFAGHRFAGRWRRCWKAISPIPAHARQRTQPRSRTARSARRNAHGAGPV